MGDSAMTSEELVPPSIRKQKGGGSFNSNVRFQTTLVDILPAIWQEPSSWTQRATLNNISNMTTEASPRKEVC